MYVLQDRGFSRIQILLCKWTFIWNQVTMMRFHYVRYCTLSEVWDYWQNKAAGDIQYIWKWSWCMGRLVHHAPCWESSELLRFFAGEKYSNIFCGSRTCMLNTNAKAHSLLDVILSHFHTLTLTTYQHSPRSASYLPPWELEIPHASTKLPSPSLSSKCLLSTRLRQQNSACIVCPHELHTHLIIISITLLFQIYLMI
jgi:hypothetical protein